jgi:serine/threonine protein kinase, bacterial
MPLLDIPIITETPRDFLDALGEVFAEFGAKSQDSGNISYGIRTTDGAHYFVKTAGIPGDDRWYLPYEKRVALLRNAVVIAGAVAHPALPTLHNVIESPQGPMLVYEWRSGELLHASRKEREKPTSPYQRFRHLPLAKQIPALDSIFAVHAQLAAKNYVAVDFYDGSILYDFATNQLTLCDLDNYHQGAFTNTMGRMFGSSRYMAPEEWEKGATIDGRTTVFTMGRLLATMMSDGTLDRPPFRGTDAQYAMMCRACQPKPDDRYSSVATFYAAWWAVLSAG